MPTEDTAPIPVVTSTARPGTRAVAFLSASGILLVGSTFLNLVTLPLPGGGDQAQAAVNAWGLDLGIGHDIPQYVGVVTLIAGVALLLVAAASLRAEFRWTRNASLVAGGIGVGSGLYLAASGFSTATFLSQLAGATGQSLTPVIGPGLYLALLGAACALVAVSSPAREETVPVAPPVEEEAVAYRVEEEPSEEES
jgi:hypothetical protein